LGNGVEALHGFLRVDHVFGRILPQAPNVALIGALGRE